MMIRMQDNPNGTHAPSVGAPSLTCEEFQDQLAGLMSENIREHEHLRSCDRCNALLDELEYIGEIAKGLLPTYDPSDEVWDKITRSLHDPMEGNSNSNGLPSNSKEIK